MGKKYPEVNPRAWTTGGAMATKFMRWGSIFKESGRTYNETFGRLGES